ncbi:MAG: NADPH-dependent FMN reductase [Armatimonadota bacterium]
MITILGITGSLRWPSHTHTLMEIALGAARESGARVELLDLRAVELPLYDPRSTQLPPIVTELRERVADAHAYIVGTPEYHGSLSGTLKNCLDYLFPEVSGKVFGFIVATGNDIGSSAFAHLREIVTYLHAWSLPYDAYAMLPDFDESGHLVNPRVRDRLYRLGRDVAVYGELIYDRFGQDRISGGGPQYGFAPWHAEEG